LSVTAATREQAVEQLRGSVGRLAVVGPLVPLHVAAPSVPLKPPGWAKDDPLEQEF